MRSAIIIFWVEVILLIAVGVILIAFGHTQPAHRAWIETIGEALIVAGVLGGTVDPYLKRKLSSELFGTALRSIFGNRLPKAIQDEIRRIASCSIVRESFEAEYRFHDRNDIDGTIQLTVRVAFVARNIGEERVKFMHRLWAADAEAGRILRMKSTGGEIEYAYDGNDLQLRPMEGGWGCEQPVMLAAGTSATFKGDTQRTLPLHWEDTFYFSQPTVGATVRVVNLASLSVDVISRHPDGGPVRVDSAGEADMGKVAFLPNMSFAIKWYPTPAPDAQTLTPT
jgi:hypothetical protein